MPNKETNVKARSGDMIHVGDLVQTVQDTIFEVVEHAGEFRLKDSDGKLWELEPYMSPNLWIIE